MRGAATYRLADGEELDFRDRALRIAQARRIIARASAVIREAHEALAAAEEDLAELHLAERL